MNKRICLTLVMIVSIIVLSSSGCIGGESREDKLKTIAEVDVIDNLKEGNYQDVYDLFIDDLKAALTVEDLETIWVSVEAQYGGIIDIESENAEIQELTEEGEEFLAVFIPCKFESQERLYVEVVFDEDDMIAGLWILPI